MKRMPLAAAALLLPLTLVGGCSAITSALAPSVPSIEVGECTNLDTPEGGTEVTDIPTVDCASDHKWEVYAEHKVDDGDFPGESSLQTQTEDFCVSEFESFVGLPYEQSIYEVQYFYPTEETWTKADDRLITCLVGSSTGGLKGSLKGVNE